MIEYLPISQVNWKETYNEIYGHFPDQKTKFTLCVVIDKQYISIFGDKINHLITPGNELFVIVTDKYKVARIDNANVYHYNLDSAKYYLINKKLSDVLLNSNSQNTIKIKEIENYEVKLKKEEEPETIKDLKLTYLEEDDLKLEYGTFTKREYACLMLRLPESGNPGLDKLIKLKNSIKDE